MAPYVNQMKDFARPGGLVPDYGYLLSAPEKIAPDFSTTESMLQGKKTTDVDSWFTTVAKPAASMPQFKIYGMKWVKKGTSIRAELKKDWPNALDTMAAVFEMGNGDVVADAHRLTRTPDVDVHADGWLDAVSDVDRLVRWPVVDACGSRTLTDICGGDADIAKWYMVLCALNVRHKIQLNTETQKVYVTALDGKDAKALREDWLLLENDDLDRHASVVTYSSKYFAALAAALWANLPVMFRRYGCLEILNQTGVARAGRHRGAAPGEPARDVRAPCAPELAQGPALRGVHGILSLLPDREGRGPPAQRAHTAGTQGGLEEEEGEGIRARARGLTG